MEREKERPDAPLDPIEMSALNSLSSPLRQSFLRTQKPAEWPVFRFWAHTLRRISLRFNALGFSKTGQAFKKMEK
jgi:hypothetical protein